MAGGYAHRKALGDWGERQAVALLSDLGMVVVDRNWRCADGEIDVVALDGRTVAVCEVKTRSSRRYGSPLEAVTAEKANRLHRLGQRWVREHDVSGPLRVDVIAIDRSPSGFTIELIRGVG